MKTPHLLPQGRHLSHPALSPGLISTQGPEALLGALSAGWQRETGLPGPLCGHRAPKPPFSLPLTPGKDNQVCPEQPTYLGSLWRRQGLAPSAGLVPLLQKVESSTQQQEHARSVRKQQSWIWI